MLRPRVYIGIMAAVAALFVLPASLSPAARSAIAWCVGGFVYLVLAFFIMAGCPLERIKSRAARQDDSGTVILVLILAAVISSVMAIAGLLTDAKTAEPGSKIFYILLAAATIFVSWSVMQVVFTFHYAHEHYAPENLKPGGNGGLDFPKDPNPDYWDFLYFATSIGASSQTSDVSIVAKDLRRLVTLHAVVSFFFNTMVLALTINLAAGMI